MKFSSKKQALFDKIMDSFTSRRLQYIKIFIEQHFVPCLTHIPDCIEKLELIVNNTDDVVNIEKMK
jgi:hypothetical protein